MYKDPVKFKHLPSDNKLTSFECMEVMEVMLSSTDNTLIVVIYRPPPMQLPTAVFLQEFGDLLDKMCTGDRLLSIGDFNFHVDDPTNNEASHFLDLINCYKLT